MDGKVILQKENKTKEAEAVARMISWWWIIPVMFVSAMVGAVITGVLLLDNCPRDDDDEGGR